MPAVLKLAPGDQDALRCKAVLLIEAGRMEEALKLLGEPPLSASMAFEKVPDHELVMELMHQKNVMCQNSNS